MRLVLALALVVCGLVVAPETARAVPGACPPICNAVPDVAWIESSSIPLFPLYRWPGLAGVAVTATKPRFEFETWCAGPALAGDAREYSVAARAVVSNPAGQWNLSVQVMHWRGDTVTGGRAALATLEKARIALAVCQHASPQISPSITTNDEQQLAMVVSDAGSRVMHAYLLADPGSSTVVELTLWSTVPALVEWSALPDVQVFDAMAGPLCAAYLGSCR